VVLFRCLLILWIGGGSRESTCRYLGISVQHAGYYQTGASFEYEMAIRFSSRLRKHPE
jgi:hypothetical protein